MKTANNLVKYKLISIVTKYCVYVCVCVCVCVCIAEGKLSQLIRKTRPSLHAQLSHIQLFVTLWNVAR